MSLHAADVLPDESRVRALWAALRTQGLPLSPEQLAAALRVREHVAATMPSRPGERLVSMLAGVMAKSEVEKAVFDRVARELLASVQTGTGPPTRDYHPVDEAPWATALTRSVRLTERIAALGVLASAVGLVAFVLGLVARYLAGANEAVIAFGAMPVLGLAVWLWLGWRRTRPKRANPPVSLSEALDGFVLPEGVNDAFDTPDMRVVVRRLKGAPLEADGELDLDRTVRATAARAGLFTPVLRPERRQTETIMLVEEVTAHDHVAHLFLHAARRLDANGLPVELFGWSGTPERLAGEDGKVWTLAELARQTWRDRLVMIGDADRLIGPLGGVRASIASGLALWPRKYLLNTRAVASWGWAEMSVVEAGLSLGTASPAGFSAMAQASEGRPEASRLLDVRMKAPTSSARLSRSAKPLQTHAAGVGWLAEAVRRAFDIVAALAVLLLTAPILLVTALAIRLDSPGPVFYRQERVGLNGRVFALMKFRSMRFDAEAAGKPQWATQHDPRVTRVGRFIRLTRVDEIPQVLNVLRGDMAFIGPRPERPAFVERLAELIPNYMDRFAVKPGITGWAQVNYPYGASIEDVRMKLAYDLYYIRRRSLFLDALILLATVRVVLFQEGSR